MYWYRYEYYVDGKLEDEDHCDPCLTEKVAGKILVEDIRKQHDEWKIAVGKENLSLKPMSFGSEVYVLKNLTTGEEYRYWVEPCS